VLAAVLWAGTTLVIRGSRLSAAPAEKTLLYQLAVSGLALTLAGVATGEHWPQAASSLAWSAFAFQVVIVTFASYLLWFWLVRHYPATRLAAFTLLTPIAGLAAGALLLHEPVTPRLLLALGGVVLGIAMVNRRAG
jgi:drug/metabolite transporter (DMT)-like permease